MNYFGHAAVASRITQEPGALLGAMLPDFATMCGERLALPSQDDDAEIARGIALHHVTDAAFHGAPEVLASMRTLDERLARAGCARGPRRAVAHIGVELLLDGVLVGEPAYRDAFLAGLACDPARARWRDGGGARFAVLLSRLRAHGVPDDLRDPAAITMRLGRMLAHRPLLAPSPGDLHAIERALGEHRSSVTAALGDVQIATASPV